MIKLDGKVKYGNLPSEIQTHLTPIVTKDDKIALLFCIVVFLDLVCAIPLLVNGERLFTLVALPFMIGINIWTLIVMFMKISSHNALHFTLYKGGTGTILSFCYFVLSQKYGFSVLGFNPLYMMTSLLAYLIVIIGFIRYYLVIFPNYKRKKKNSPAWGTYLLTLGPGAGYIAAQFIFRFSDSVADLFMSYMYLLMACLSSYVGIKFVHQFIFVKANQDIINQRLGKGRFSNDPK
ncbi:hypothetical protein VSK91_13940 [Bacillus swezeyi]|uniref:hypothetical protein n=1 Tax=Bacillus swezeyi TaxID=1925020 RepID=UPI0039C5B929